MTGAVEGPEWTVLPEISGSHQGELTRAKALWRRSRSQLPWLEHQEEGRAQSASAPTPQTQHAITVVQCSSWEQETKTLPKKQKALGESLAQFCACRDLGASLRHVILRCMWICAEPARHRSLLLPQRNQPRPLSRRELQSSCVCKTDPHCFSKRGRTSHPGLKCWSEV